MFADAKALDADLVHGRHPAHGRHRNVRAFCIALLATGNVGAPGTGANIFRGIPTCRVLPISASIS